MRIALGFVLVAFMTASCDDNDELKNSVAATNATNEDLTARLATLEATIAALQSGVAQLQTRLTAAEAAQQQSSTASSDLNARTTALEAGIDGLISESLYLFDGANQYLGRVLDFAYAPVSGSPLLFFNPATELTFLISTGMQVGYSGSGCTGSMYANYDVPGIADENIALFDPATGKYFKHINRSAGGTSGINSFRYWDVASGSLASCVDVTGQGYGYGTASLLVDAGRITPFTSGVYAESFGQQ